MISGGPAPGCAAMQEGNWTRSNFCWATSPSRRPRDILAVSNAFKTRSTIGSASSPAIEQINGTTVRCDLLDRIDNYPFLKEATAAQIVVATRSNRDRK